MFEIGDKVVYPMHGAGIVINIDVKEVLGEERRYYILRMPINGMRVMVPVENAKELGVRYIYGTNEMDKVFEILKDDSEENLPSNWNRRYRFNMARIKSGDLTEIAKVVRCLTKMDEEKTLSTGERKLLNNARQIIVSEMALVYDKSVSEIDSLVEKAILA